MKLKSIILVLIVSLCFSFTSSEHCCHALKVQALNSTKIINLSAFSGKKILIVNVASKCGYTPQYSQLEILQNKYRDQLVVLGCPTAQFNSEFSDEVEIANFCSTNYNVSFPMTSLVNVKGKNQHELYSFLTKKELNGYDDFSVNWNFFKFLVDEQGKLIAHFDCTVSPLDSKVITLIEN